MPPCDTNRRLIGWFPFKLLCDSGTVVLFQARSAQDVDESQSFVSGAPVVDAQGRCVGVLSTTDFLYWVELGNNRHESAESVCHSWQIFGCEVAPIDTVGCFMTADPVLVSPNVCIGTLAQTMLDARIHRVIVADLDNRPIGIVSSTDVLAAIARELQFKALAHNPGPSLQKMARRESITA